MTKKIKVCFVSLYAYPLFNPNYQGVFGGSEVQIYLLTQVLARNPNFEVYLITRVENGTNDIESYGGIKILRLRKYPNIPRKGYFTRSLWDFFTGLKRVNADIYIQRAAGEEAGQIAFFCKLTRRKFVYMVASTIDVSGEYVAANGLRGRQYAAGLKNASIVILQTETQKELLRKNFRREGFIMKSPLYPIEEVTLGEKSFILWAGRADPCKRPELFIELARAVEEEKFVMICQPHPNYPELFTKDKTSCSSCG